MTMEDDIKDILDYDPETGEFIWLVRRGNQNTFPGKIAGFVRSDRYRRICTNGKRYLAHRLAWFYMTGEWPESEIDHINGVRDDNRWENLRLATHTQNIMNANIYKNNTSGYKGVYCSKKTKINKWRASIRIDKILKHLGCFDTLSGAARAYNKAAKKHFGEFANLNEVKND